MAYNPKDGFTDLFGGREDLKARIIRAVGDPYRRFDEDALRILRAVRFSSTLGFKIEKGTAAAAEDLAHLLSFVSGERIYTEIKKLIAGPGAYRVLIDHRAVIESALGIKGYTVPDQMRFASSLPEVRFFSLFAGYQNPAEVYNSVCDRLKVDNAMRDTGTAVLSNLSRTIENRTDVKLCLGEIGVDNTYMLSNTKALLGHRGTCIHCHVQSILELGEAYTTRQLKIGGKDLLALGYRGREVGEVLEFLLTYVINGDLENERDALLDAAKLYTPLD
jgi:tRNA nucleotidyltransferase (CCA-adding enzyme)